MNIYLISQTKNTNYDSYDSAVVLAESELEASLIHPDGKKMTISSDGYFNYDTGYGDWVIKAGDVSVQLISKSYDGIYRSDDEFVICASFNAG